ncbi:hypothetical protein [Caballeronia mineralivorans]|jgi:hypothetical protein|uniref:hypothetical protein n=1 Tax=Caballeronia mineralivorans TaxID=2010198 RepID=UPI0023F521A0|nr:hypothetical protein [Caballeronia mineralivorans]MDB5788657.1 uncharacterized protein [Caballeronia mineralivorans]
MKSLIRAVVVASALGASFASFAQSSAPVTVAHDQAKTFDVFVDQPTGFTFVKMPTGWKFVGAVSKEDAQHLPGSVLTAVLPSDASREIATASRK